MAFENKAEKESIAKTLARFIHNLTYNELSKEIQDLAKTRILDALSCAYAGRDLPHSRTAIAIVKNSPGDCTVIGHEAKVALLDAVMANSVLAHSILQEDTAFKGHPGTMIIPVAIALGEQERSSGKEALVAIVAGYELMGRVSKGVYPMAMNAFRPGPIMGTIGAAATAGKLLKLNIDKLTHALGYAASLTPGVPNEGWWGGTMEPVFEAGVCARMGILSANLAKGGATTAPSVLEGKHGFLQCWAGTTERVALITEGLGKTFVMSETVIKAYPACGINQLPIQAALHLAKLNLKSKQIVRVVEKTKPGGVSYAGSGSIGPFSGGTSYAGSDFGGPFSSQFQAQMSMQFCAAAAILGRPINSLSFFAEHYDDPEVAELAAKVELVCEDGRIKPRFEVYTHDGKVFTAEEEIVDYAPYAPSRKNAEHKFIVLASNFLGKKKVSQIIELVLNLEEVENIRELTDRL